MIGLSALASLSWMCQIDVYLWTILHSQTATQKLPDSLGTYTPYLYSLLFLLIHVQDHSFLPCCYIWLKTSMVLMS